MHSRDRRNEVPNERRVCSPAIHAGKSQDNKHFLNTLFYILIFTHWKSLRRLNVFSPLLYGQPEINISFCISDVFPSRKPFLRPASILKVSSS